MSDGNGQFQNLPVCLLARLAVLILIPKTGPKQVILSETVKVLKSSWVQCSRFFETSTGNGLTRHTVRVPLLRAQEVPDRFSLASAELLRRDTPTTELTSTSTTPSSTPTPPPEPMFPSLTPQPSSTAVSTPAPSPLQAQAPEAIMPDVPTSATMSTILPPPMPDTTTSEGMDPTWSNDHSHSECGGTHDYTPT